MQNRPRISDAEPGHTDCADEAKLLRDFLAATLPRGRAASAAAHADSTAPAPAQSKSVITMGGEPVDGAAPPSAEPDSPRPDPFASAFGAQGEDEEEERKI